MAKEIQCDHITGKTLYAQIFNQIGQIWNTSGTPAFETYATANIANYSIAMTEAGTASAIYQGTFPTAISTSGVYLVKVREKAGASNAESDACVASGEIEWSGTAVNALASIPTILFNYANFPSAAFLVNSFGFTMQAGLVNLDAGISTRMATYTQPTGFLAAIFPAEVASRTNITGGTLTNLTNAPTAGDFTAAMKASIGTAVAGSAVASVTGNVGGNVVGSVGSVVGLTASDLAAIKAKTDNLPSDPASSAVVATAFGIVNNNLATIAGYIDTEVAAIKTVTDHLATALVLDGSVYQFTANALELAPSSGGGGATAEDVWTYAGARTLTTVGVTTFTGPVIGRGKLRIIQGDTYHNDYGNALNFTFSGRPDLTTADAIWFYAILGDSTLAVEADPLDADNARVQLTSALTVALTANLFDTEAGKYRYALKAYFNGEVDGVTYDSGLMDVRPSAEE